MYKMHPVFFVGASVSAVVVIANIIRIRRSRRNPVVVVRAFGNTRKKKRHAVVILPGTARSSDVWLHRMNLLAERGYDCHCLNLVQNGCWTSSYAEQIDAVREYVSKLDCRPILIGHSQGGTKVQNYLLAKNGDSKLHAASRARGAILLGSSILNYTKCAGPIVQTMMGTAKAMLCTAICTLGGIEVACFFGGGIFRHFLQTYSAAFNEETSTTTLLTGKSLSIEEFADHFDSHEPILTDGGVVPYVQTPSDVLDGGTCEVLVLSGENDRMIPKWMVEANAKMWSKGDKTESSGIFVEGQGHELGDPGWEDTVMPILYTFLDSL